MQINDEQALKEFTNFVMSENREGIRKISKDYSSILINKDDTRDDS